MKFSGLSLILVACASVASSSEGQIDGVSDANDVSFLQASLDFQQTANEALKTDQGPCENDCAADDCKKDPDSADYPSADCAPCAACIKRNKLVPDGLKTDPMILTAKTNESLELQDSWSPCFQREQGHSNREYCSLASNDNCIRRHCESLGATWTGSWEHCAGSWWGWVTVATRGRCSTPLAGTPRGTGNCPDMQPILRTGQRLTGKYSYNRAGYTDIDDYLKPCSCACTAAPMGWRMVEEGVSGQYGDGYYYIQFMTHWGNPHRRRDASDACRCAKVQQISVQNHITYDWNGDGPVDQTLGTCNLNSNDEYVNRNCYFKSCLLHDVCLLKYGHETCTPYINLGEAAVAAMCRI